MFDFCVLAIILEAFLKWSISVFAETYRSASRTFIVQEISEKDVKPTVERDPLYLSDFDKV